MFYVRKRHIRHGFSHVSRDDLLRGIDFARREWVPDARVPEVTGRPEELEGPVTAKGDVQLERWEKIFPWMEERLGGRINRRERQGRESGGRFAWFVDLGRCA